VHALKGKSTRKKPRAVVNNYIEISKEFKEAHKGVIPFVDIFSCALIGSLFSWLYLKT